MQLSKSLSEIEAEFHRILNYWTENTLDHKNGGFIGEINFNEEKNDEADKGSVLTARILWTFSSAYAITGDVKHLEMAARAFKEIKDHFYNAEHKGVYWSITPDHQPKDTKNQIYALAFVIYGLSEYYKISENTEALFLAQELYHSIEQFAHDKLKGGYFEAFTQDWQPISDMRLSDKDANVHKTMNTHLHIAEAYANLYVIWKDEALKKNLIDLLKTIETHFINQHTGHLHLFFDEEWNRKEQLISYGHDIEAAWLLLWCAEVSEDENLIRNYKKYAVQMADATLEGLDKDGGLWYELEVESNTLIKEKHWWPQAELWIGFVNAYQITNDKKYLKVFTDNWQFTKKFIIDHENGEWFWGINEDYSLIQKDKAGFWKCPYHNSRACIEVLKRLDYF